MTPRVVSVVVAAIFALAPALPVAAQTGGDGAGVSADVGQSRLVSATQLLSRGFSPFETGGETGALFAMAGGDAARIYLCYAADTEEMAAERRAAIASVLNGEGGDVAAPNVPVLCFQTE